ncbi:LLM class F420-dependent oxidoreductase [Rhodococcus sovatensis]|uniref:LLM class F420-dependent oxidoreductase n=1 Tax=Rhodococcus sovatensis TaxID=1805840 RepID=A0ABZ2PS05_9NOCA
MRLGIVTPVLIQHPRMRSDWESAAEIEDVAQIARTADELGYHHITCSEHIAVPADAAAVRGGTYWDPLATFGYLSAMTTHIRLATHVLVLGYHHPLEIAKRYGTLDRISGGRLILGVGVGTLEEEFDLIGAPFQDRGPRADDALTSLRSSLSTSEPEYHGRYYDFENLVVEPHALQDHVPIWVGGSTSLSLRRAVEHGDGWVPFGISASRLEAMLAGIEMPAGFEVVLSHPEPVDPLGAPGAVLSSLDGLRRTGATIANVTIRATDRNHYCDQLCELRRLSEREGITFSPALASAPIN